MKKFIVASVVLVAVAMAAFEASADVVVYYSFNNTSLLNGTAAGTNAFLTADTGSAISTASWGNPNGNSLGFFLGGTPNAQPGFAAGNSLGQSNTVGTLATTFAYDQFTLNATGLQNIIITWDYGTSSTGPRTNSLLYSADGGTTFTDFADNWSAYPGSSSSFITISNNLSAITALNGEQNDVFRVAAGGATSNGGTWRLDNFTITATAIPEPSTVMLVGCGLAGLLVIRRRRS